MGHHTCCVVNCKNNGRNSSVKFYTFPGAAYKQEQKRRWIAAIRRINIDGSPWIPKQTTTICSAHFIDGKKSNEMGHPSYVPSIFPDIYKKTKINETAAVQRYQRLKEINGKKKQLKEQLLDSDQSIEFSEVMIEEKVYDKMSNNIIVERSPIKLFHEKGCQAEIFLDSHECAQSFTCIRYIYSNYGYYDAQTQTEIPKTRRVKKNHDERKFKEAGCNTDTLMETVDNALIKISSTFSLMKCISKSENNHS